MVVIFLELGVFQHENDDCFDICYLFLKKACSFTPTFIFIDIYCRNWLKTDFLKKDDSKVYAVRILNFEHKCFKKNLEK